jgi:hypothetical protein
MPKLHPFVHKGDFPNLETFNIYNYEPKLRGKCHICKFNKHKMRIRCTSSTMYEISLKNEKI